MTETNGIANGANGSAPSAASLVNGGAASMGPAKDPIIDGQPWFTEEQVDFIQEQLRGVLLQPRLSNGPWTAEFETAVARTCGVKYATAFPSGTAALEAALTGLGVGAGDEVLLPAESPVSNAMAIRLLGAKPVFCDISAESHCIEPDEITAKATPAAKAVILVHAAGLISPAMAEILGRAQAKGLALIEDCAQAQGATWQGHPAGSIGVAGILSFDSSQVLTTGEGGAVVTSDKQLSRLVQSIQDGGRDPEAKSAVYARVGRNQRFPEISALLGLAQCRHVRKIVLARNETAAYYRTTLEERDLGVSWQPVPANTVHAYRHFLVNLPQGVSCSAVKQFIRRRGIPVPGCPGLPLYRQPVFADICDADTANCPVADESAERSIALPTSARLTQAQKQSVVDAFVAALSHARQRQSS